MIVKVQTCWTGHSFVFRALIAGGLRIPAGDSPKWTRKHAKEMLDLIEIETGISRHNIRFRHV